MLLASNTYTASNMSMLHCIDLFQFLLGPAFCQLFSLVFFLSIKNGKFPMGLIVDVKHVLEKIFFPIWQKSYGVDVRQMRFLTFFPTSILYEVGAVASTER